MEEHNIPYFRNLWQENVADLQKQCEIWEKICLNESVPEDVLGDIRTNIGLARLLMNQKLKQFKGLIDDSEFNRGEKEITCLDLQGFWDMVYHQVEKIKNCFEKLEECKNNGWKSREEDVEKFMKKKVPIKKEATVSSRKDESSKSRALAAKQRLAEAKKKMMALREQQKTENFVEMTESNANEITKSAVVKESNENSKQEQQRKSGRRIASAKLNSQIETTITNVDEKSKLSLENNNLSSTQNKENYKPENNLSSVKRSSKAEANTNEIKEKSSVKKRGKSKDYGKLQCVTRSAKKALLVQYNTM